MYTQISPRSCRKSTPEWELLLLKTVNKSNTWKHWGKYHCILRGTSEIVLYALRSVFLPPVFLLPLQPGHHLHHSTKTALTEVISDAHIAKAVVTSLSTSWPFSTAQPDGHSVVPEPSPGFPQTFLTFLFSPLGWLSLGVQAWASSLSIPSLGDLIWSL